MALYCQCKYLYVAQGCQPQYVASTIGNNFAPTYRTIKNHDLSYTLHVIATIAESLAYLQIVLWNGMYRCLK